MAAPLVTAVVVSYNSRDDLSQLLPALRHDDVEVVVVDNASTDDGAEVARELGATVIASADNAGWARGCNRGADKATAPVLAFVNPDARPSAETLLALARRLDDQTVGATAPKFVDEDGRPQSFYFRFPSPWSGMFCFLDAGQRLDVLLGRPFIRHRTYDDGRALPGRVDQPGAACLLVRAADFDELGGFADELFLFFADTDLCRRLHDTGRPADVAWDLEVTHRGGGSVRALNSFTLRRHFQRDWLTYLRRRHGKLAVAANAMAVVVLTGLVPALTRLLRGRPGDAWAQLKLAAGVLR